MRRLPWAPHGVRQALSRRPARRDPVDSAYEETVAMASMSGTIKRLVRDKGFGFISAGGAEEYFFHSSACSGMRFDDLREGQQVSFDVGRGPKGPRAENVRVE